MKIKRILLVLMLVIGLPSYAGGVVYEVSKGKQKLYIGGTIHLLRPSDFPLPVEYEQAYKQATKVVFETDMDKAQSPEFSQKFSQAMLLPNNKTLKDILAPEVLAELQAYAEKAQYPLSQTMMFSPAMHSILIVIGESKKLGIGEGVDAYYYQKAKVDQKAIGDLEKVEEVLTYMQALNNEDPNVTIRAALKDVEDIPKMLIDMIDAWRQGDLNTIQKNLGDKMKEESPLAYETLVITRNKHWYPQIKNMLQTPEVEFVMVGSLHLSGADGLLAALKKDGYKIVQAK